MNFLTFDLASKWLNTYDYEWEMERIRKEEEKQSMNIGNTGMATPPQPKPLSILDLVVNLHDELKKICIDISTYLNADTYTEVNPQARDTKSTLEEIASKLDMCRYMTNYLKGTLDEIKSQVGINRTEGEKADNDLSTLLRAHRTPSPWGNQKTQDQSK